MALSANSVRKNGFKMARIRRLPTRKYLSTLKYAWENYVAKDFRYPFYCTFKVIQRCDSRCEFCDVWRKPMPDLPKEKVLKVIDNVANSSVLGLSIEGGEPLLRSDIGEILEYVRTKPLYLELTTSGKLIDRRPMKEYAKLLDFLNISIDEGHKNLDLYDSLPEYVTWGPVVCVQIVVMRENLQDLEEKIKKCYKAGAKSVVMPACRLPGAEDKLPDIEAFRKEVFRLKKAYPDMIITTDRYLKTLDVPHSCSTSSVLVEPDARIYYPCQFCVADSIDASQESLIDFLHSKKAKVYREKMKGCDLNCHCYLYFALGSSLSLRNALSLMMSYVSLR